MDINKILKLNLELEADIRLYKLRKDEETRELLIGKFNELSGAINSYFADVHDVPSSFNQNIYIPKPEVEINTTRPAAADEAPLTDDSGEPDTAYTNLQVEEETILTQAEDNDNIDVKPAPPTFLGIIHDAAETVSEDNTTAETSEDKSSAATKPHLIRMFTINDKFRFIREIFNNDKQEFESTLEYIATFDSLGQVYDYLLNDLGWDVENESVEDFISIISNHFNEI